MRNSIIIERVSYFLATGFYSGLSPMMPGSAGTLAGAIVAVFVFALTPSALLFNVSIALAVITLFLGVFVSNNVLASGRYGAGAKDPREIVIDEFAGYYVSIIGFAGQMAPMLLAFVLFRVFDNWKPAPISHIERIPGAWGIMLDDIAAGIYALVLTHLVIVLGIF